MVDQHAAGRGVGRDGVAEDFEPRNGVEIEAENHVGLRDGAPCAPFGVGLEDHHLVDPGHPVEEIGIFIGHDAGHRMSHSYAGPRPMRATIRRRRRRGWCGRRRRCAARVGRASPADVRYVLSITSFGLVRIGGPDKDRKKQAINQPAYRIFSSTRLSSTVRWAVRWRYSACSAGSSAVKAVW